MTKKTDVHSHWSLLAVPKMFFPGHLYHGARALDFLRVLDGDFLLVASRDAWATHKNMIASRFTTAPSEIFFVEKEPTARTYNDFSMKLADKNYASVVGVGGGSTMDVAKTAHIHKENLQVILIPTTAGSGSEVSRYSLFVNEKGEKEPLVSPALLPDVILYDPVLLTSLSPELTACTTIDAYAHALEGLTSRLAHPISDLFAREALSLILKYAPQACRNPENLEARTYLQTAGFLSGLVQSSASVGLAHGMADFFGPRFALGHGRAIALFLLPVIRLNLKRNSEYYKKIQETRDILECTRKLYGECGLDTDVREALKEARVSLEEVSRFIKKDPAVKTHQFMPSDAELEEIMRSCGITCVR
ncbi:MAG: iron-containing alcohol dehydrogenase [bacterium]|nr:iron-containing alcohol dehydrogenase [bacterium]MDZ4284639.1 iron-containing alcohol dehydrogenase [Patescibacteria group bacterium]